MNILIIGGSGFLGTKLIEQALPEGHTITSISRGQKPVPKGVTSLQADRKTPGSLEAAIGTLSGTWDLVLDVVCYEPAEAKQAIALLKGRTRSLVFISTDFVYDPKHKTVPHPEDSPHYLDSSYGGNKRECEKLYLATHPKELPWTILRPCHIYGPGSRLGCLPLHGRDPQLIQRLRNRETLKLVGGGKFLQQPIYKDDLTRTILSTANHPAADGKIFNVAGPDIVESWQYYQIIADLLNVDLKVESVSGEDYIEKYPAGASFCCHRVYDLSSLKKANLHIPSTPLKIGLKAQVESLL